MKRFAIKAGVVMLGVAGICLAAGQADAAVIDISANITTSQTWTSNNEYVLMQVIYVTNGATLTIEPGTVIRGEGESSPGAHDPGTLVITRGSKLFALGTAQAPIVFTDLLDDNVHGNPGTFPYDHLENALGLTGQWGGVILLGRTYVSNNTLGAPNAAREVQIEGLDPAGGLGLYGNGGNDDDDSGTLNYVSIRYGGFNLSANNEINGLTLGGVGRQTDIDYIDVFNPKDDGVEAFGGTVNLKHIIISNGGDDGLDYDEGYRGKVQFYAVLQGTPGADKSDKGGEWDGGNNPDGSQPFGLPTLYNLTFVGLGQKNYTNKLQNTAMHFRDNGGGRAYNSFFADFGGAPICIEGGSTLPTSSLTSGERAITPYVIDPNFEPGPASDFQLELKSDNFWCFGNGGTVPAGDATAFGCDAGKVHYDNGLFSNASLNNQYQDCVAALPIRALGRTSSGSAGTPDPITSIDPRPVAGGVLTTTSQTPPNDGFFEPAPYKGAFSPISNWAAGWTTAARLGYFPAVSNGEVIPVSGNITTSQTWTSNNEYVLMQVIYVTNGATLTIEPGTVIRGEGESSPGAHDPGTLVITRSSKLFALGTAQAPIVFTDLLDDNVHGNPGTFPYDHLENALGLTGQWGGVILLGRTYVSNNTLGAPNAAREVQIEGLDPAGGLGLYGNGGNDDDDSGTLNYVSIRYGGFNLSANNEINGLTLGGVGRQTDIDYVDVFNPKDDGVEAFGGTVNLKHIIISNGGDDGLDYDEGYRGKVQFYAVLQGTPGADKSDKGGEWDGGNNPDGSQPFGLPTLYNLTFVGLGQKNYTNKLQNTAMHFRDNGGGRAYNSFFADFGGAPICIEGGSTLPTSSLTSGERAITPYVIDPNFEPGPASDFQLELKSDNFWCFGNGGTVPAGDATAFGCDAGKVHYDNGLFSNASLNNQYQDCVAALPIRALGRTSSGSAGTPDPITSIDPRPVAGGVLTTTSQTPPNDGFFEPAPYKGAFSPISNWAAGWTTAARLGYVAQCSPSALSSVPDESSGIAFGGPFGTDPTRLTWTAPPSSDGPLFYDLLRSTSKSSFASALCVETDDTDTSANDTAVPPPGTAFYYLVRAGNACGEGTLGVNSNGVPRTGPSCP